MVSGQDLGRAGGQDQEGKPEKKRAALAVEGPAQALEEGWRGRFVLARLRLPVISAEIRLLASAGDGIAGRLRLAQALRGPSGSRDEACPQVAAGRHPESEGWPRCLPPR